MLAGLDSPQHDTRPAQPGLQPILLFHGRISPVLIICAACLERLGVRCFCAFGDLLKHHKITEGDTEIVDIALHPQLWRPGMQRERELGCGPD